MTKPAIVARRQIVLIAHDIRSAHNVGSLLRTADGLAINCLYFTGVTPYPAAPGDKRLPHVQSRATKLIRKTALGAEISQKWLYAGAIRPLISQLRRQGYIIIGLEQAAEAISLPDYDFAGSVALVLGNEINGLDPQLVKQLDGCVQIPMLGKKESFNVVQAAAMALYHLRFIAGQ